MATESGDEMTVYAVHEPLEVNEECPSCGGDIGPSSVFPWHWGEEDCRGIKEPLTGPTIFPHALSS